MAVTENLYTGDGSTVLYSFTFPYLATTDVKVSLDGSDTTAYSLANATQVQLNTAPASGVAIRVYRDTADDNLTAEFFPGAAIKSSDLNNNFTQSLYVTQESNDIADKATTTANTAKSTADTALATANSASTTANTASTNATNAVSTANTASTNATAAVNTANTASSNATTAVNTANTASTNATNAVNTANTADSNASTALSTANTAATNASTALSTANTASTNASNAVTTANTASTTANTASTNASSAVTTANTANATANAASAAVANAAFYTPIAALANLPGSPSNEDRVEVTDSTGVESNSSVSGVPYGFTGSSDLTVRLQYNSSTTKWEWKQYFASDPESRYLTSASFSSPTFTGVPVAPTATQGTNTTQIATTAFVNAEISADTAVKAPIDSPTFTGTPAAPTATQGTNTTQIATTEFVNAEIAADTASKAPLASPTFTGVPAAPTAVAGTNTTQIATTAFVTTAVPTNSDIDTRADARVSAAIGSTVQGYDADTTKNDVANTFTAAQTLNAGLTVDGPYKQAAEAVGALAIDLSAGNYFTKTISANSTFTFTNPPSSGTVGSFTLELTHTSGTVTWPASVKWPGDTAPTLTAGKTHLFFFVTDDGGTRYRGASLVDYVN